MALEINDPKVSGNLVEVDAKLWRTADRDRLVPDGDPDAAFLYCTPGMQVPRAEAERFGLLRGKDKGKGDEPEPEQDDEPEPETEPDGKAGQTPPNKARGSRRR